MTENNNQHDNNELPLFWKKLEVSSKLISSILIPLAIGIAGLIIDRGLAKEDLNLKYVGLATEILKLDNLNEKRSLSEWAVNNINYYADVKMSKEAKKEAAGLYNLGTIIRDDPATKTDFDIFVCQANQDEAEKIANNLIEGFKTRRFGQIRYNIWTKDDELSPKELKGKATIILDKDHAEKGELNSITTLIKRADKNLNIQTKDNSSSPTPWLISIVLCP